MARKIVVVELDGKQPEFSQTFWRYLDGAISDARVNKGRALMQQNAALLVGAGAS